MITLYDSNRILINAIKQTIIIPYKPKSSILSIRSPILLLSLLFLSFSYTYYIQRKIINNIIIRILLTILNIFSLKFLNGLNIKIKNIHKVSIIIILIITRYGEL